MKRVLTVFLVALIVAIGYLCFWPVPAEPKVWRSASAKGYVGVHAPNRRLAGLQPIALKGDSGPEHVALGPDGLLYAAVASGRILRMNPDGSGLSVFADTGGRVLGFDFDAAGHLIAADAMNGLLSIDTTGKVRVLTDTVAGDPIRYADAVAVAADGKLYFSDASRRFAPADWGGTFEASVLDILEQSATGRILVYEPATRSTRVLANGLSFANGVALSADGRHLFVNETGRSRIWKLDVTARDLEVGSGSAQAMVLFDNLPGYPDNLTRGRDGRIWAGFAKPRNATLDALADKPFLRKLTLRLPRAWWPIPKPYGHVFAFTEDGRIVADLQDPDGAYPESTGVTETADRLYIQSLHAGYLGWMPNPLASGRD